MTSSIIISLKESKNRNPGFTLRGNRIMEKAFMIHQYNEKTKWLFDSIIFQSYQMVRKLSIRFKRNPGFTLTSERFSKIFFSQLISSLIRKSRKPKDSRRTKQFDFKYFERKTFLKIVHWSA